MSDENPIELVGPVLESPPETESPVSDVGASLFGDESLCVLTAKLTATESFLKLAARDLKFSDFSRELLMTVMRILKCEAGTIFELDEQTRELFFRAAVGQTSDRVGNFRIPMGQGIVGHVAESRQPLLVSDVKENKLHIRTIGDAVGFETRNLIAVPLVIRGKTFGVLELLNRIGEPTFNSEDLDLLNYISELMSKTIEVRLMMNWTQHRLEAKGDVA